MYCERSNEFLINFYIKDYIKQQSTYYLYGVGESNNKYWWISWLHNLASFFKSSTADGF